MIAAMARNYLRESYDTLSNGWNRFWFAAVDPATLALIRIFTGAMLLYTHSVWGIDLAGFLRADGRIPAAYIANLPDSAYAWSYWYYVQSPAAMWALHIAALVVFAMLTVGMFSRIASILAFLIAVSYINRLQITQFGLDQINVMLAMYLMVGPSGAAYSVDSWWRRRNQTRARGAGQGRGGDAEPAAVAANESVSANIAIRLIQLHMCVIYFFAGISKAQGDSWWQGMAVWGAVANYEYQSIDVTFLAAWPLVINLLTHATVFWELFYCVLIWPRLTRPMMLAIAVPLHLGIAFFMGMITFGLIMLVGNLAFVSPVVVRAVLEGWRQNTTNGRDE